jgi:hypothetical protein
VLHWDYTPSAPYFRAELQTQYLEEKHAGIRQQKHPKTGIRFVKTKNESRAWPVLLHA